MAKGKFIDKNYFQHNYGARNELAMLKLRSVHGQAGYGAYWEIIEKLFESDGELNLRDIPLIAYELHLDDKDQKILESVIKDFGLFEINPETNDFTADMVTTQLEYRKQRSEEARAKVNKRYQKNGQTENNTDDEDSIEDTKDTSAKILLFKERFPDVAIDLSAEAIKRKFAYMDIEKLTAAINESTELKNCKSLLALCDKYDRAIKGYYKDKPNTGDLTSAASALSKIFPNIQQ